MAYQAETSADWPANVYQVAQTDPVLGGNDGPVNIMGLALSKRSLYQRMRNVTAWDAALAAAFGYVAGACVRHGTTTWRAIVDNNVAPGTNATKWERWAFSESELDAKLAAFLPYGAPTACPSTGPDGAANKARIHKSALGEYWMWLGDAWKVVANYCSVVAGQQVGGMPANTPSGLAALAAPRAGKAMIRGVASFKNSTGTATTLSGVIYRVRGGVTKLEENSIHETMTTLLNQYAQARPIVMVDALAGDTYSTFAWSSNAVNQSLGNFSSVHLEYLS